MDDDLLQDFLAEAGDLLDDVDQKLVELEQNPNDKQLLNSIFRGFHTIKGGAGFLDAAAMVDLCHRTETLFDGLRSGTHVVTPDLLDIILASTAEVRRMFGEMARRLAPDPAPDWLLSALDAAVQGEDLAGAIDRSQLQAVGDLPAEGEILDGYWASGDGHDDGDDDHHSDDAPGSVSYELAPLRSPLHGSVTAEDGTLDWQAMYDALRQRVVVPHGNDGGRKPAALTDSQPLNTQLAAAADSAVGAAQRQIADAAGAAAKEKLQALKAGTSPQMTRAHAHTPERPHPSVKESTIRVDTQRFDQILNLSGEIGLTKNRLNCLRAAFLRAGGDDLEREEEQRKQLDAVMAQLDMLVGDLQAAVMKARMQPVGRVFQKYGRLARDVARGLGKDVELVIVGAETEVDKTILEEMNDPLVHLIRNAVDHGVESPVERIAAGKPARGIVQLLARQAGDHIIIEIRDDGRGMDPARIRAKAVEKGIISHDEANGLDNKGALNLIFLPGFSTKDQVTDVSGRGVGMDVVQTNIAKLKGRIELDSTLGQGSRITISLPLTLAILPVLMMSCCEQVYSVPLSTVREIISIHPSKIQNVNNKPVMVIRGDVLPMLDLAELVGRERTKPAEIGVVAVSRGKSFVMLVDGLVGQDEVMIKPLEGIKPKGVSGATLSGEGVLVLVLELHELLEGRL